MEINFSISSLIEYVLFLTFISTLYYSIVFYETAHIIWLIWSVITYIALIRKHIFLETKIKTTRPSPIILMLTILMSEILFAMTLASYDKLESHVFRTLIFISVMLLIVGYAETFNIIIILKNNAICFWVGSLIFTLMFVVYMLGIISIGLHTWILPNSQVIIDTITIIRYGISVMLSSIALWMMTGSIIHWTQTIN